MTTDKTFEVEIAELNEILDQIEDGDLLLDRALDLYGRGVNLLRNCKRRLDEAEDKIETLLRLERPPLEEPCSSTNFEASLGELEQIVQQLDSKELPLERILELAERGVALWSVCQARLTTAERRVELLIRGDDGALKTIPFDNPEE